MDSSFFKTLKNNWAITLAFIALVGSWAVTGYRLTNVEERTSALERKQESEEIILTEIRTKISSIETSILFIKDRVK